MSKKDPGGEMIVLFKELIERMLPVRDRCVIDQDVTQTEERVKARFRADAEHGRAIEQAQRRESILIGAWARNTVGKRERAPIQTRVRAEIAAWLLGLGALEVMAIANAPAADIHAHMYSSELIAGVRAVQPLPPCVLVFPRPKLMDSDIDRSAGGGPRRRFA